MKLSLYVTFEYTRTQLFLLCKQVQEKNTYWNNATLRFSTISWLRRYTCCILCGWKNGSTYHSTGRYFVRTLRHKPSKITNSLACTYYFRLIFNMRKYNDSLTNKWMNKWWALTGLYTTIISDLLCIPLCFNPLSIPHFGRRRFINSMYANK